MLELGQLLSMNSKGKVGKLLDVGLNKLLVLLLLQLAKCLLLLALALKSQNRGHGLVLN